MSTSAFFGLPLIESQQAQPELTHNEMVLLVQAMSTGVRGLQNAPPGGPVDGEAWIVGTAGSGAWVGHNSCVAVYFGGGWLFVPGFDDLGAPISMGANQEGIRVWRQDLNALWVWTGAAWADFATASGGPFVPIAGGTMTDPLQVPAGSAAAAGLQLGEAGTGLYRKSVGAIGFAAGGVEEGSWDAFGLKIGDGSGVATHNINVWDPTGITMSYQSEAACAQAFYRMSANLSGPIFGQSYKGRGSWAAAAWPNQNDILGDVLWGSLNASSTGPLPVPVSAMRHRVNIRAATPGAADQECESTWAMAGPGSATLTDTFGFRRSEGLKYDGSVFLNKNRVNTARAHGRTWQGVTPLTGFSQTISNYLGGLYVTPAGTLATGTITMPSDPVDGQECLLFSTQTITALTHNGNTGQTITGALTTMAANTGYRFIYRGASPTAGVWLRF